MKSFIRVGLLVGGMTGLLVVALYTGKMLDDRAVSHSFQPGTNVAGIEIGGMTPVEAQVELETITEQRRNQQNISLHLYDFKMDLPKEALVISLPELNVENAISEMQEIDASVDITVLTEAVRQMDIKDGSAQVDIAALKQDIEQQLNDDPAKSVSLHLAPYIDSLGEKTVLSNVYAPYIESTLLENWVASLDGFIIEPRSTFSLKEALATSEQLIVNGESLDLLASKVYQLLAKSNFHLIEHHSPNKLPSSVEIGLSASVDEGSRDLVFNNANYDSFEIKAQYSQDGLILELIGTPYINEYELVVEDKETIEPRKEVQYSQKRRAGDAQVIRNGKSGSSATLYRKVLDTNLKEQRRDLLARNYVAAISTVEERSVYQAPEPEPTVDDSGLEPVIVELPEDQGEGQTDITNETTPITEPTSEQVQPSPNEGTDQPNQDELKGEESADKEQSNEN